MTDTNDTFRTLRFEAMDQVGLLTLASPASKNALSLEMREELGVLVGRIRNDPDLRALVITGSSGNFCSGGDLRQLSDGRRPTVANRARIQNLHVWFRDLVNLELPVVAAVDGPAFGAGLNLALSADFVFASPRASFCAAFGRIGLVPDLGGFFLLPRIVGLRAAKDIVFTARTIDADEALSLGIVSRIFPQEELLEQALAYAARFKAGSRDAIGQAKVILNQSLHQDQMTLAELESYSQAVCMESEYHHAAVKRFLDKQPLEFNWKN